MKDKIKPIGYLLAVLIIGIIIGYLIFGNENYNKEEIDKEFLISLAKQSIIEGDWCFASGGYWYGEPEVVEIAINESLEDSYKQLGFKIIEKNEQKYIQAINIEGYCIVPTE